MTVKCRLPTLLFRPAGTAWAPFRDITGESPGELRKREQIEPHQRDSVPGCYLSAANRPDLTIAVLEKRRLEADVSIAASNESEVP